MPYTDEEVALAKSMFERARAQGKARPRAIAVMVGLSRPEARHVVRHEPHYRDYLKRARISLRARVPGTLYPYCVINIVYDPRRFYSMDIARGG